MGKTNETTKMKLHTNLNKAYVVLLGICLELDLKSYYGDLERGRSFMSNVVDHSDLPVV